MVERINLVSDCIKLVKCLFTLSAVILLLFTADSHLIFKEVPLGLLFIGIMHNI